MPERRRYAVAVGAIAGVGCWPDATGKTRTAAQKGGGAPKPQVSVVTLHPQSVAITGELPGRTTASLTAEIRPQVNGIIKARLFKQGSEVKAGDPLYQIDPATYQAALDSALATLQKAQCRDPERGSQGRTLSGPRQAKRHQQTGL